MVSDTPCAIQRSEEDTCQDGSAVRWQKEVVVGCLAVQPIPHYTPFEQPSISGMR
jgi:hypothetical protein